MEGSSSKQVITSPSFHVPEDINVRVESSASLFSVAVANKWKLADFKCRISGTQVFQRQGDKGTTNIWGVGEHITNCTPSGTGVLSTGNSTIELENSYTMSTIYVKVYNVGLYYN